MLRRAAKGRSHALAVLVAGLLAAAAGVAAWAIGFGGDIEQDSVAARFRLQPGGTPSEVAVVAIDDKTFSELKVRWPFRRTLHARALDELRRLGARRVVYDVQFTEPSWPDDDWALYRAVQRFPGTILAATETDARGRTRVLGGDDRLAEARATAAAANFPTMSGGKIARVPAAWQGLPTIAVAATRSVGHHVDPAAFERGGALIAFRGPPGTIPTVSFVDLLRGDVDPALVRDRIVVVGATAPTLQDVHPTPTSGEGLMAGAEVQANAIWTVLHDLPLRQAPGWVAVLAAALLGLAPALAGLWLRALSATLTPLIGLAYVVVAKLAFDDGVVLPVVGPLAGLAAGTLGTVTASYVAERRERRRVSRHNEALETAVRERTEELRETQLEIVRRLAMAAEWRDEDTGAHIERMSRCAHALGLAAGLDEEEAELLRHAAALHDVGKIGVPDRVLLKEGPLDEHEWDVMRGHAAIGASILAGSRSPLIRMAEVIARTHHERWDGTGYPARLAGEQIPLVGRICAICDVFDALLSRRPYKEAWPLDAAIRALRKGAGSHFDPALVELFIGLVPELAAELHGLRVAPDPPDEASPAAEPPLAA